MANMLLNKVVAGGDAQVLPSFFTRFEDSIGYAKDRGFRIVTVTPNSPTDQTTSPLMRPLCPAFDPSIHLDMTNDDPRDIWRVIQVYLKPLGVKPADAHPMQASIGDMLKAYADKASEQQNGAEFMTIDLMRLAAETICIVAAARPVAGYATFSALHIDFKRHELAQLTMASRQQLERDSWANRVLPSVHETPSRSGEWTSRNLGADDYNKAVTVNLYGEPAALLFACNRVSSQEFPNMLLHVYLNGTWVTRPPKDPAIDPLFGYYQLFKSDQMRGEQADHHSYVDWRMSYRRPLLLRELIYLFGALQQEGLVQFTQEKYIYALITPLGIQARDVIRKDFQKRIEHRKNLKTQNPSPTHQADEDVTERYILRVIMEEIMKRPVFDGMITSLFLTPPR